MKEQDFEVEKVPLDGKRKQVEKFVAMFFQGVWKGIHKNVRIIRFKDFFTFVSTINTHEYSKDPGYGLGIRRKEQQWQEYSENGKKIVERI